MALIATPAMHESSVVAEKRFSTGPNVNLLAQRFLPGRKPFHQVLKAGWLAVLHQAQQIDGVGKVVNALLSSIGQITNENSGNSLALPNRAAGDRFDGRL